LTQVGLVIFVSELCNVVYISLNVQYMHLGCPVAMSCNSNTTRSYSIVHNLFVQNILYFNCRCWVDRVQLLIR